MNSTNKQIHLRGKINVTLYPKLYFFQALLFLQHRTKKILVVSNRWHFNSDKIISSSINQSSLIVIFFLSGQSTYVNITSEFHLKTGKNFPRNQSYTYTVLLYRIAPASFLSESLKSPYLSGPRSTRRKLPFGNSWFAHANFGGD